MNLVLLVYVASIIESLSVFFGLFGFIGLMVYFGFFGIMNLSSYGVRKYHYEREEELSNQRRVKENFNKYWKLSAIIFTLMIFTSNILPSERTIYLMAGAYATEQIASNERVQKIGNDVLEVIENKLEQLKESK